MIHGIHIWVFSRLEHGMKTQRKLKQKKAELVGVTVNRRWAT